MLEFTLRLGEKRKEEKGEEEARFVKIVEFSVWNSSGVIPTRYVRSNSVGLGARLVDFDDGGIIVQNNSEPSLVTDVKVKRELDQL
uniref:Uncharacterized protein n=1 Tax=Solanum tuberosum TaxID=4113 RepID=M1DTD3_SOLTU